MQVSIINYRYWSDVLKYISIICFFFDVLKTLISYLCEVYKCGRFWIDGKKLISIWRICDSFQFGRFSYATFFKFGRFAYACFLQFGTSWIVSVNGYFILGVSHDLWMTMVIVDCTYREVSFNLYDLYIPIELLSIEKILDCLHYVYVMVYLVEKILDCKCILCIWYSLCGIFGSFFSVYVLV